MKPAKKRSKSQSESYRERLYEQYRPKSLDKVIGQDAAINKVKRALSHEWGGRAWWISGASGVGKTTLARIIARERPGHVHVTEYNSAHEVTAKVVDRIGGPRRRCMPRMLPEAFIINEAHILRKGILQDFLGILEGLQSNEVVIFTTTRIGHEELLDDKIDARPLLSRCIGIELTNQGLAKLFAEHCQRIAKKEGLDGGKSQNDYLKLARRYNNNCRAMLVEIEAGCMLD